MYVENKMEIILDKQVCRIILEPNVAQSNKEYRVYVSAFAKD